jgi:hypothetical protein
VKDLQQCVGAKVVHIGVKDGEILQLVLELADGSIRDVEVYHPYHEDIAVRIDGMYVPPEER